MSMPTEPAEPTEHRRRRVPRRLVAEGQRVRSWRLECLTIPHLWWWLSATFLSVVVTLMMITPAGPPPARAATPRPPVAAKPLCVLSSLPVSSMHAEAPTGSNQFGPSAVPPAGTANQLKVVQTTIINWLCGTRTVGGDRRGFAAISSVWTGDANRPLPRSEWQREVENFVNHMAHWNRGGLTWRIPGPGGTTKYMTGTGADPFVGVTPARQVMSLYYDLPVTLASGTTITLHLRLLCWFQPGQGVWAEVTGYTPGPNGGRGQGIVPASAPSGARNYPKPKRLRI